MRTRMVDIVLMTESIQLVCAKAAKAVDNRGVLSF